MFEVELRYSLRSLEVPEICQRLTELAFVHHADLIQRDIYYTSRYKDMIESEECLRIRTVDGESEITWKPPSTREMQCADAFWKREIDLPVGRHGPVAEELLEMLDFVQYCIVEKKRRLFIRFADQVEAAVDDVTGCGFFIELEKKSSEVEEAQMCLDELAKRLQLKKSSISKTPYRDIVKGAARE